MKSWRTSWRVYSIGLFSVWVMVLLLAWKLDSSSQLKNVLLIFYGYFAGWLSATFKVIIIRRQTKPNDKNGQ